MPPINFTYAKNQPAGYAGALATTELTEMISRTNEDEELIGFGVAIFAGEEDRGGTATPTAGRFEGITALDRAAWTDFDRTVEGFRPLDTMLVCRVGVIWVNVGGAVDRMAPVYVTPAGVFTATEAGNVALPGAKFATSTTEAGLAQVRLVSQ